MNWLPVSIASCVILGTSAQTTCISSAVARRWLTWLTSALLWQRAGGWQTASGWPLVARTQVRSLLGSGWSIHTWSTPLSQQAHLFTPLLTSQVREGHWAWWYTLTNSDVVQKSLLLVVFFCFCFITFLNLYIFGRSNWVEPTFSWQSILCVKVSVPFGRSQAACFSRHRKAEPTEEAKRSKISSVRSKSVWLEFLACCSVEIEWSNHGVRTHAPSLKSKKFTIQTCAELSRFPGISRRRRRSTFTGVVNECCTPLPNVPHFVKQKYCCKMIRSIRLWNRRPWTFKRLRAWEFKAVQRRRRNHSLLASVLCLAEGFALLRKTVCWTLGQRSFVRRSEP